MSDSLASVLARYPTSARPRSEPIALGNAGGLSGARLWRFEAAVGPLVARRWPENGPGREEILRIHAWIARARHLAFVPIPIETRDRQSLCEVNGQFWSVEPWKPGVAVANPTLEQGAAAFSALARFHLAMGVTRPAATSPGLVSRVRELEGLLSHELDAWIRIVDSSPDSALCEVARRWLRLAVLEAPRLLEEGRRGVGLRLPIQPIIRDARSEHVLFTDDCVTGMVDFGAMGVDCVSADMARLLGTWSLFGCVDRSISKEGSGERDVRDVAVAPLLPSVAARQIPPEYVRSEFHGLTVVRGKADCLKADSSPLKGATEVVFDPESPGVNAWAREKVTANPGCSLDPRRNTYEGEGGIPSSPATVAIAAYQSIRALDDSEVEAIGIFGDLNGLLVGARWLRWHFVDRIVFSNSTAVFEGLRRSVATLLHRAEIRLCLDADRQSSVE